MQHKTAPILNVSYGQCELVLGAAGNTQYNNLWQTAAAEGISAPGEDETVFNHVPELDSPRRMDLVADRLSARGYSAARIEKIIGGNWLRLFADVWK